MRNLICMMFFLLVHQFTFGQDRPEDGIREMLNLSYLSGDKVDVDSLQRLNLVLPVADKPVPLLVWIGGGAWSYVDRHVEMDLARAFAREGIAVAAIGHRLSPATWRDSSLIQGIEHPGHIEDLAAAVAWLVEHSDEYNYDQEQFFVGGFSSGAHLAALLCMDSTYLAAHGLSTDLFKGVIPVSGTFDVVDYYQVLKQSERPELAELHVMAVFGDSFEKLEAASPVTYLEHFETTMLLMSDNALTGYTKLFEDRLRDIEYADASIIYALDLNHGGLWRDISGAENSVYREAILAFIRRNAKAS